MSKYLPEGFVIPTSQDYNDIIAHLHEDVVDQGGARYFLPTIRLTRRRWADYDKFLTDNAMGFLRLEAREDSGGLKDPEHQRANAMLCGEIFGQLLAENLYPFKYPFRYAAFAHLDINYSMLGELHDPYFQAGGSESVAGLRFGYEAMAMSQLSILNRNSLEAIREWTDDLIPSPVYRPLGMLGVGCALYQAWDWATDRMAEEGNVVSLPLFVAETNSAE